MVAAIFEAGLSAEQPRISPQELMRKVGVEPRMTVVDVLEHA